jgi:hypothetical protein
MKPLLVGSRDYYSACLFRLEETRGHLLSEAEYAALRKETLDELAAATRKPVFAICAASIALLSSAAGLISLATGSAHPSVIFVLGVCTLAFATITAGLLRKVSKEKSSTERLEMLESLREHRLVSDGEFTELRQQLKAA